MANISEISIGGTNFGLKDAEARDQISNLKNAFIGETVRENAAIRNIPANFNDTEFPLGFYNYTDAGNYILMCYHDGDSGSGVTNDRFRAQGRANDTDNYTNLFFGPTKDHTSGWKCEYVTLPFKGNWRFGRNVDGNTNAIAISDFCLIKLSSTGKRISNSIDMAKSAVSLITPYSDYTPTFTRTGSTINFLCGRLIAIYKTSELNTFTETLISMSEPLSVPHDSHLVFNRETKALEVITDTNYLALEDSPYIHMFYNSNGIPKGEFYKYLTHNWIPQNYEVYFYGQNKCPKFHIDANDTITVDLRGLIPRINAINKGAFGPTRFEAGQTIGTFNPSIYVVPHDHCLVYTGSTHALTVESYTPDYSTDRELLFYNSKGTVNGPWRIYWLEYMLNSRVSGSGVPDYYAEHLHEKVKSINLRLAGLTSGDAFVFISDIHYPSNRMNSPALIKDVCSKSGITSVVLNGDYINRESLKADAMVQINRVCSLYEYPGINTYRVVGNHEFNNPPASSDPEYLENELSASELRWPIINPNRNNIVYDTNSLSYYFDNEKEKIRYFVGAVTRSSGTVAESIRWIAGQVENVPAGWGVVIFQHTVLSYGGNVVHVVNEHLENIINAMKAKTAYNYLGTTFDYTGKSFEFIACFCGDYHLDMDYTTANGAKIIATTCDCYGQQEGSLDRTVATYNEQAFDVVVINRSLKKIFMTRIGAGTDREYSFA